MKRLLGAGVVTLGGFDSSPANTQFSKRRQALATQPALVRKKRGSFLRTAVTKTVLPLPVFPPMLNLELRDEFKGPKLKGTTIDLSDNKAGGALKRSAAEFLGVTYPSTDLLRMVESVQPAQTRAVVLLGGKGLGKSHLMAALYHCLNDKDAATAWLQHWANTLSRPEIAQLQFREGTLVIAESLSNQRFKFLWDILFSQHPHGNYVKGKWDALGKNKPDVPSDELLIELLENQPVTLLLDEFQTWFDGLTDTATVKAQKWAFNFIQLLSQIAETRPELLTLVVSIRDNNSESYQQMHRVNPVLVNFQGTEAKRDRQRLLLYRIFSNRLHIAEHEIESVCATHVSEHLRLQEVPASYHDTRRHEFIEAWPFSPNLMRLLEDQVLIATAAQETRDLIRILVELFKSRGDTVPVITAADFLIDDNNVSVTALLQSVSSEVHRKLLEKAQRNLEAVHQAVANPAQNVPNAAEIISALWLRSLSLERSAGAEPVELHVDITRGACVDDNAFQAQLALIRENSFNIHPAGNRIVFKEVENAEGKLLAHAKNDKAFAVGGPQAGCDLEMLASQVRYVIGGTEEVSRGNRVVVLQRNWRNDPWSEVLEADRPDRWDDGKQVLVVLPEYPDKLDSVLGPWLKSHVHTRRNTLRFLLPTKGSANLFHDRELLVAARATYLARLWKATDAAFTSLFNDYQKDLRDRLRKLFDTFVVLDKWNYAKPDECTFVAEKHGSAGEAIPQAIQKKIEAELFVPEEFEAVAIEQAQAGANIRKFLDELAEPRLQGQSSIPWLGEVQAAERVIRMCAAGKIMLNVRGLNQLQAQAGESEDACWQRIKGKVPFGSDLKNTTMHLPGPTPTAGGGAPPPATTPAPGGVPTPGGPTQPGGVPAPGGVPPTPGTPVINDPTTPNPFGGGAPTPPRTPCGCPPKTAMNLLGELEKWGIGAGTPVFSVNINIASMTGAQLKALIEKLPPGVIYGLNLDKES